MEGEFVLVCFVLFYYAFCERDSSMLKADGKCPVEIERLNVRGLEGRVGIAGPRLSLPQPEGRPEGRPDLAGPRGGGT